MDTSYIHLAIPVFLDRRSWARLAEALRLPLSLLPLALLPVPGPVAVGGIAFCVGSFVSLLRLRAGHRRPAGARAQAAEPRGRPLRRRNPPSYWEGRGP